MENPVTKLPPELLLRATAYLTHAETLALSTVNSQFRKFFLPTVFKTLKVTNREEDAAVNFDVAERHGRHVETLHYECHIYPNASDGSDDELNNTGENSEGADSDGQLRHEGKGTAEGSKKVSLATAKLFNDSRLPNVTAINLTFAPYNNFEDEGFESQDLGCIYICMDDEGKDDKHELESDWAWRAVLRDTMHAVAQNTTAKKFTLLNLPPSGTTAYFTEQWQSFLSRIEIVNLEIWGSDNGAGWHANTVDGYLSSIGDLNNHYIKHLSSCKSLRLAAHIDNPIGCEGMRHTPIPLQPDDLPNIELLELENCFVDPNLVEFLTAKSDRLKTLRLVECMSAGSEDNPNLAENAIPWAEFFSSVRNAGPVLTKFEMVNNILNRTRELDEDMVRQVERNDTLRIFHYILLDDKYGMVFTDDTFALEQFERGEDQREFNTFMDLVRRNSEASSQG